MRDRENRIEFSGAVIFLIVAAIGIILLALVAIGPLAALLATLGVAVAAIIAFFLWGTRTTPRTPAGEAPHVIVPEDDIYRLLVITDETATSPVLAERLRAHAGDRRLSAFVLAPPPESRWGSQPQTSADTTRRLHIWKERWRLCGMRASKPKAGSGRSTQYKAPTTGCANFQHTRSCSSPMARATHG